MYLRVVDHKPPGGRGGLVLCAGAGMLMRMSDALDPLEALGWLEAGGPLQPQIPHLDEALVSVADPIQGALFT